MVLVSACLTGKKCRYDGEGCFNRALMEKIEKKDMISVCPEYMARLPVPRTPAEISGGDGNDVLDGKARVYSKDGKDLTREFIDGAEAALALCLRHGVKEAFLKTQSPSCGVGTIYDGTFTGTLVDGTGVTAALLMRHGIGVTEVV